MIEDQRSVCQRYGAAFTPSEETYKVGVAESALRGEFPLHGLRHPPESGTTGWFIWSGELSEDEGFFRSMHLYHLTEACPAVMPFLALPAGWRFLIAPGYEDVWSDNSLLDV